MTAVANVTNMGSMSSPLRSKIMKDLWQFVFGMGAWLTICHLAGSLNCAADAASHVFRNDRTEWGLPVSMFMKINEHWGPLQVDLFASSANTKLSRFIAWQPDRGALTVDAFTVHWKQFGLCYAMPPFTLIARVLRHLNTEHIPLVMVIPLWESQPWFPHLLGHDLRCSSSVAQNNKTVPAVGPSSSTSSAGPVATDGCEALRESFRHQKFLARGEKYVINLVRPKTYKNFMATFKKWKSFCKKWNVDTCDPCLNSVAEFLY